MFFIFHAKPKRGVQTYFGIKQRENVVSNWMKVFAKQMVLYLPWQMLIQVIVGCNYVNLLIFLTLLGSLLYLLDV